IARLEQLLGHPLFLRTPRGLVASEAALGAAAEVGAILSGLTALETGADAEAPPDLIRSHDLRLSLRLVTRFAAVVEAGSIGHAAAALRVTQPQISRQIAELEDLLATVLFVRHPYGATATPAAQRLYARARPLCDVAEALVQSGNRRFSADLNTTRLGSVPPFHPESRLAGFLSRLCIRWTARHPGASLAIATEATDGLVAALMSGSLHAAIVETDEVPDGCTSRPLFRSELELVVGATTPDAAAEAILTSCPLALQSRSSGLRRMTDSWLRQCGLRPPFLLEVDSMPVIGRLVGESGYCSIIPRGACPADARLSRTLPLPDAPVFSQSLIWRQDLAGTRQLRRLLDLVDQALKS
ncbi:MAG: LysR family transcriptional regulator, partial [Rhodobacterales bacterium]|nr:LysR family transcriptional regulator [Rhodobacterales bacterium]